ncbi:MAG TPA: EAL domain-containing protein [Jatrophihabitans sp.]|jgi:diguanylate cyclase (GGDEF)-like protein
MVGPELVGRPLVSRRLVRGTLVGHELAGRALVGQPLELTTMPAASGRARVIPRATKITSALTCALAAAAAIVTTGWPSSATLAAAPPVPLGAVLLVIAFSLSEWLLMNVEFRRQAHSFTLAGIPLVLGALVAPIQVVVLARVLGAGTTLAVQRIRFEKFAYNLAAFAFEAAIDTAAIHYALGGRAHLDLGTGALVFVIVTFVDQLMSALVLVMIYVHNGPMSRRAVTNVLLPALAMTSVSVAVALGVVLLTGSGQLGFGVVAVGAVTGVLLYRGYLAASRRHAALELVHEFVTGTAGNESFAEAARELLPRLRTLLRAGAVEMLVIPDRAGTDGTGTILLDSEDEFRAESVADVDRDWATLRALSHGEPLLAPRSSKDRAVLRWLAEHGHRDAMLVPFPPGSGVVGTITVSDRLGETSTFTTDDLTLLQTLTGHLAMASSSARMVEQLAYDASHDSLTGLASRAALVRRISEGGQLADGSVAVMLLDLDRFKEVNDALGHAAGDAVLQVVADRLRAVAPSTATVARLGGDEFAVYLCGLNGVEDARRLGDQVAAELARPLNVDGAVLNAEASIGIAVADREAAEGSSADLMRQADTAMYAAKSGDEVVAIYRPEMDQGRAENLALLADLRTTLRGHPEHFTLYYQPKIDLGTREVIGAEALVRWNHPELGVVAPDRFIPLAETSGLIHQFTPLVLARALADCRRWAAHGNPVSVAVNVSARNVGDQTLPRQIKSALADAGMPAGSLVVEITESCILAEPDRALKVLQEIADLGVCISLDDFGTGYSSLSYLHRFPASEVKIDKSFVQGLGNPDATASAALVSAVAGLGQNLSLRVVAEGVETPEVLDTLAALGCHAAQGYTIARPQPAEEFLEWLTSYRPTRPTTIKLAEAG